MIRQLFRDGAREFRTEVPEERMPARLQKTHHTVANEKEGPELHQPSGCKIACHPMLLRRRVATFKWIVQWGTHASSGENHLPRCTDAANIVGCFKRRNVAQPKTESTAARALPGSVPLDASDARFRGETRQPLSRRHDHRRRLHRTRARKRSARRAGCFCRRAMSSRPLIRDQAGRSAFGEPLRRCRAHLSRFALRPDARTRRKYSPRSSEDRAARDDQPSRRDDSGRRRQIAREADEGREGFRRA